MLLTFHAWKDLIIQFQQGQQPCNTSALSSEPCMGEEGRGVMAELRPAALHNDAALLLALVTTSAMQCLHQ